MSELASVTLEDVVVGRGFADLDASPLQRAVCRAARGQPLADIITAEQTSKHFGVSELPAIIPTIVCLVCGVRAGKSFLACCSALHAVLTADLSSLKSHELPRYVIVGPTVDSARATFVLLLGILRNSPVLSRFVVGEPTTDTVTLQRPDGRTVEIVVVAAHRGGLSVRNRWLLGCCMEETAQFGSEAQGAAVSAEELLRASETRLLPGCQVWIVSSPYGPQGLLWDLYSRHFGKPGRTLVIHSDTRSLNPSFPQAQIDEIAAQNPDIAAREFGASWVDSDTAFLDAVSIDKAIRKEPLHRKGLAISAAMDPGTRSNSWTLSVAWLEQAWPARRRVIVGGCWQWQGSKQDPLSPRQTLREIATILRPYGISSVRTDKWSFDAIADHAASAGLHLIEPLTGLGDTPYYRLRSLLNDQNIELPPDPVLRSDLLSLRARSTSSGVKVHLPLVGGRHADHAPALALAATFAEGLEYAAEKPRVYTVSGMSAEEYAEHYGRAGRHHVTDAPRGRGAWHRPAPDLQLGRVVASINPLGIAGGRYRW